MAPKAIARQMGSWELVVLVMALTLGLILGGLIPWITQLVGTGHPMRRMAIEEGRPRGHRSEMEPGTARAALGALLAIVAASILTLLLVPSTIEGLPSIDDIPGGAFSISFGVLIVAVAFALPRWLGVVR